MAVWLFGSLLPAIGADHASVHLLALDAPLAGGVPASIERFASQPLVIPAVFLRSNPQPISITGDLYVDGDALGALLTEKIPFEDQVGPPLHPLVVEGAFKITLPDSGKARLRLLVYANPDDKTAQLIGQVAVRLTPAGELKSALEALVKPGKDFQTPRLFLFGPLDGLRNLLNEWKIPFEDGGDEAPAKIAKGTLAVGEAKDATRLPELPDKSSLWLLHTDAFSEVGVSIKLSPRTCMTLVKDPRPQRWPNSPFLHRQLIAQIQRHLELHE